MIYQKFEIYGKSKKSFPANWPLFFPAYMAKFLLTLTF